MVRILLIDDDKDVRETIGRNLTAAGHDLVFAENGAQGLRSLRTNSQDLVICDILMPEKEGLETIMEIRSVDPETKIIAISGGGTKFKDDNEFLGDILESAKMFGADEILSKPFRPRELLDLIEKVVPGDTGPG